jgi:hypothetical protein
MLPLLVLPGLARHRMTASRSKPLPVVPAGAREAARIAGWALGLQTLVSALGAVLAQHRGGAVAVQALVAEWGAGRLGVAWSDPTTPPPNTRAVARRAAVGALLGAGAAAATVGFAWATRAVSFEPCAAAPSGLVMGVLVASFVAVRDELLLRGLVLRAFRHTLAPWLQLVVCGVVAAAARAGQLADTHLVSFVTTPEGVATLAIAGLGGVCFATLWLRERGAWTACGAHAAWAVATSTAISGGVCDARFRATAWGGWTDGFDASLAVVAALGVVTAAATFAWHRGRTKTG